jgi:hypothetical protein
VLAFSGIALLAFLACCYSIYKLKNFLALSLSFVIPILFVFINNHRICASAPMSEQCTWAYLGYVPASLVGIFVYLSISIYQAKFKNEPT